MFEIMGTPLCDFVVEHLTDESGPRVLVPDESGVDDRQEHRPGHAAIRRLVGKAQDS
jgi:hypothetical protein